jgi:hypothetical protein
MLRCSGLVLSEVFCGFKSWISCDSGVEAGPPESDEREDAEGE